jgi:hypothetical protein
MYRGLSTDGIVPLFALATVAFRSTGRSPLEICQSNVT